MSKTKTITYVAGDNKVTFYVDINAKKLLKDFAEHEKHLGLSQEQLKEAYEQIKKAEKGEEAVPAQAAAAGEIK